MSSQHVLEVIQSGGPARDEFRGPDRAAGEVVAARRAVGQFEALPIGEEVDGVIADHVAAAQGLDADGARAPLSRVSVTLVDACLSGIEALGLGRRLRELERGAARSV